MRIFIRLINRIIKRAGWRVVPLPFFTLVLEALYREGKQVCFIQVGANDGIRFDNLYHHVTGNKWEGLVIEPIPSIFARLSSNYLAYNSVKPLNVAIHPTLRETNIYRVKDVALEKYPDYVYGIASMDKDHLLTHGIDVLDIEKLIVDCTTLMEVINTYTLQDIDLIQIDTEGFDYEVITTIDFNKTKPRIIKFEWMNLSQKKQKEAVQLLQSNGYVLHYERDETDCIALLDGTLKV